MRKRGRFEAAPQTPAMNRRRRRKDPLLQMFVSSVVSLLLCCTMFLSTTMAWFSDTVISAGNQITIGTLEVDVLYNGHSLKESNIPLFTPKDGVWSPGMHEIRQLTIQNNGTLDINYNLGFLLSAGKYAVAQEFSVYIQKMEEGQSLEDIKFEDMSVYDGSLRNIIEEQRDVILGTLKPKTQQSFAVALYLREDVNSEIQGESLTLNIKLVAQQATGEEPAMFAENRPTTESTEATETTETTTAAETMESTETTAVTETTTATEPQETTTATEPPETTSATEPPETTSETEPSGTTESTQPQGDGTE